MVQWQAHELAVESLLDKLRYAILGFLQPRFPANSTKRSQQRGAIRAIVERLTFCVAATDSISSADVLICSKRLYAVLTHLFFEYMRTDQTYYNMLRLMVFEDDMLARMVERYSHTPASFQRHYRRIEGLDANLESVVLLFLLQDHRLPPGYLCSLAAERAGNTPARMWRKNT